jgi:hypothetical protein
MPYEMLDPVNGQVTQERGGSEGKRGDKANRSYTLIALVMCCVLHADPDVIARVIVCICASFDFILNGQIRSTTCKKVCY